MEDLPMHIQPRLAQRKSIVHQRGFWAVRECFNSLDLNPNLIDYAPDGAPLYPDGEVSISHSKSMAAVVKAPKAVGIDIEQYTSKIHRIQPRFQHPAETFQGDITKGLVQLWTAKEALYKTLRIPGISFKEQLRVTPFQLGDSLGDACFLDGKNKRQFRLHYFYTEAYVATIALEK
ncbi:MAG: 4'-phosphopantetheinyl transferase superfamily protein [Flavobacteriaceae bacterium]